MPYKKKRKYKKKKIKSEKICSGFVPESCEVEVVPENEQRFVKIASAKKKMVDENNLNCGKAGRKFKFGSPKELKRKIDEYFENCGHKKLKDVDGDPVYKNAADLEAGLVMTVFVPSTICGLSAHLGFASRQSIWDYSQLDNELAYIVKSACLRIEEEAERLAASGVGQAGNIFRLKNIGGWRDKSEVELSKAPELHFDREDIDL
jgi:hypothetical protein